MHFSNYLSKRDAHRLIESGIDSITMTPTAMKQTPRTTLEFLKERGVGIRKKEEKGRPRRLSKGEVKRILAVRKSKLSFYKIASLTGVPKSTVFDYCSRNNCVEVSDDDIEDLQLEQARALLSAILEKDLEDEVNQLALKGLRCGNAVEMEGVLRRINDIVQFHSP